MEKEKKLEIQTEEIYSKRLLDGTVLETIYNKKTEDSVLAVSKKGEKLSWVRDFEHNGKRFIPIDPQNILLTTETVKLASNASNYGSEMDLYKDVRNYIHKYLEVSEESETLFTWYVMLTWVYDEFRELPYLRAIGDMSCGKSRFLDTLGNICYKSISLNGAASTSVVFRIVDAVQGTLLFDEGDINGDTTNETIKILNCGFQKNKPVLRSEEGSKKKGKSYESTPFTVYGPKILTTRREFGDDGLESRCLTTPMKTLTRDDIPTNLDDDFDKEGLVIRNKLLKYRFDRLQEGIQLKELPKLDVESRFKQIATPIYSMIQSEEARTSIIDFIKAKELETREIRYNSFEGEVFRSFLEVQKSEIEPTCQEVADHYNEYFNTAYNNTKAKKIGKLCETIFHLERKRLSGGTVIIDSQANQIEIQKMKKKYGVNLFDKENERSEHSELTGEDNYEEIRGVFQG